MKQNEQSESEEGIIDALAVSLDRLGTYGAVEDLENMELADIEELERSIIMHDFGPLLGISSTDSRARLAESVSTAEEPYRVLLKTRDACHLARARG